MTKTKGRIQMNTVVDLLNTHNNLSVSDSGKMKQTAKPGLDDAGMAFRNNPNFYLFHF